jgi:DNA-binding HxlR family transcriptional regulator
MQASTEDIHKFIAFIWGSGDEMPKQIPRLSLDIWLDILLAVRRIIDDDPEKHRYTSIKSRIKNQYPDNVFSWMLNQLVELGFLTKKRDNRPSLRVGAMRYFLTENGAALVAMFENLAAKKGVEEKQN